MKTLIEKTDKVQEYKNGGGRFTSTTTIDDTVIKQEIRTKSPEKFEQIKNNLPNNTLNNIPNDIKYIE